MRRSKSGRHCGAYARFQVDYQCLPTRDWSLRPASGLLTESARGSVTGQRALQQPLNQTVTVGHSTGVLSIPDWFPFWFLSLPTYSPIRLIGIQFAFSALTHSPPPLAPSLSSSPLPTGPLATLGRTFDSGFSRVLARALHSQCH